MDNRRSWALLVALVAIAAPVGITSSAPGSAEEELRLHEDELMRELRNGALSAPLHVVSADSPSGAHGDVYAVVDHSFALMAQALARPSQWCDVLILHLNVKRCEAGPQTIAIMLGGKHATVSSSNQRLEMRHALAANSSSYMKVALNADEGPLDTRALMLTLEALPARGGGTFVHFEYDVAFGGLAHLLLQGYLATLGRDKLGFSWEPGEQGAAPRRVGGPRGMAERNAMRYYLAIVVYLDSLSLPENRRVEARLRGWFDATERYPQQLHEIDADEYMRQKREALGL